MVDRAQPIFRQPYRASTERRKAEEAEIQQMLDAEVIALSVSEWASPDRKSVV